MHFLGQIQPLLTDVVIHVFDKKPTNTSVDSFRTILTNLAPLLDGIHRLRFCQLPLTLATQCFGGNMLAKLKVLSYNPGKEQQQQENINFMMNWLTQEDNNDRPRLLHGELYDYVHFEQILKKIRQVGFNKFKKLFEIEFCLAILCCKNTAHIRCQYRRC